jgi:hypothetical protein
MKESEKVLGKTHHAQELEAVAEVVGHDSVEGLGISAEPTVDGAAKRRACPF